MSLCNVSNFRILCCQYIVSNILPLVYKAIYDIITKRYYTAKHLYTSNNIGFIMIKIKNPKKCMALLGIIMSIGINAVLLMTFLIAYFNADKEVLVTVNTCNEASFEIILIPITFIFVLYSFIHVFRGE